MTSTGTDLPMVLEEMTCAMQDEPSLSQRCLAPLTNFPLLQFPG